MQSTRRRLRHPGVRPKPHAGGERAVTNFGMLLAAQPPVRMTAVCGADGAACAASAAEVWGELRDAAEAAYDRTAACAFVPFVGYEYTATPFVSNLHRLVVFRTAAVPERPPTVFEQPTPPGLWRELAATCLDAGIDCDGAHGDRTATERIVARRAAAACVIEARGGAPVGIGGH